MPKTGQLIGAWGIMGFARRRTRMLMFEIASAAVSASSLDALTAWAAPIRTHAYAYPLLEVLHIVGIALLLGNLVLVELRVWGVGAALPIQALARLSLMLVLLGFGLAALTGALMFASNAGELISNRAFVIKMALLMAVGLNAAVFHARQGLQHLDAVARAQTALSLLLWLAVVGLGRAIAYV